MDGVRLIVGVILPYLAVGTFLAGMVYRFYVWKTRPSPAMTLFPAAAQPGSAVGNAVKDAIFFRNIFNGDRILWMFAWSFHVVLALVFVGHFRVVSNVDTILLSMGMTKAGVQAMSGGVGGAAGIVILLSVGLLLGRRFVLPRVREITGVGDYASLLLIGAIILTGDLMRFGAEHFDLTITRAYFARLLTFSDVASAPALQNNLFLVHLALALLLIMVIPFSKILHFGGIFFTQHLIRKH